VFAYAVRRVLAVFPVMAVVVVFVFVLLRLAPGDPAAIIAGDYATPDAIAKIRTALGLDQPIYVQLGVYVSSLAPGRSGPITRQAARPARRLPPPRPYATAAASIGPAPGVRRRSLALRAS
jgi:ABC-type dipeptide/oligopeptide/nickel transport system permease component